MRIICSSKKKSSTVMFTNSDTRAPVWKRVLTNRPRIPPIRYAWLNEPLLLVAGEASHHSFSGPGPFQGEGAADFFRDIVRLVIGEVVLTPQFGSGPDD